MQGTQFAQFSAEVLRRGAAAVLPQHLPDRWLDALLEEADLLAPEEGDSEESNRVQDCCAGLLGAVLVVLMEQRGHPNQLDRLGIFIFRLPGSPRDSRVREASESTSVKADEGVD